MALAGATAEAETDAVSIRLGQMPQQAETLFPDDDWTGLSSAVERRKRQNRLNQRAYSEYSTYTIALTASFIRNCH